MDGGATVEPIESRVMGTQDLSEVSELDAIAVVPVGWRSTDGVVLVEIQDEISLPLLAIWPAGTRSLAVERVRQRMIGPPDGYPRRVRLRGEGKGS